MRRFVVLALLAMVSAGWQPPAAAAPFIGTDFAVDDAGRERLVCDIVRALEQKFVFPEQAQKQLPRLIGRWTSPPFTTITWASEVVRAIDADLTDAFHDGHLMLLPGRADAMPAAMLDSGEPTAAELAKMDKDEAITNYGIADAKVLDGNIGYLELMRFADFRLPGVKRAIADAMKRVRDTGALIIDLRWNGGGDGDTVAHVMGYLLDKPVLLLREYDRVTGKHNDHWTPATVPGPRYGARRPVWVLTSKGTFSGGEELAYDVQTQKRGRLVGETTGGGAHHNQMVRVGGNFVLSVPTGTVESPVTHTSWERVGVTPDVSVPAEGALDVALAEARQLRARSRGE